MPKPPVNLLSCLQRSVSCVYFRGRARTQALKIRRARQHVLDTRPNTSFKGPRQHFTAHVLACRSRAFCLHRMNKNSVGATEKQASKHVFLAAQRLHTWFSVAARGAARALPEPNTWTAFNPSLGRHLGRHADARKMLAMRRHAWVASCFSLIRKVVKGLRQRSACWRSASLSGPSV